MFMYLVNYGIVDHLKSFVNTFYDFIVDCGVFMNTATQWAPKGSFKLQISRIVGQNATI